MACRLACLTPVGGPLTPCLSCRSGEPALVLLDAPGACRCGAGSLAARHAGVLGETYRSGSICRLGMWQIGMDSLLGETYRRSSLPPGWASRLRLVLLVGQDLSEGRLRLAWLGSCGLGVGLGVDLSEVALSLGWVCRLGLASPVWLGRSEESGLLWVARPGGGQRGGPGLLGNGVEQQAS